MDFIDKYDESILIDMSVQQNIDYYMLSNVCNYILSKLDQKRIND